MFTSGSLAPPSPHSLASPARHVLSQHKGLTICFKTHLGLFHSSDGASSDPSLQLSPAVHEPGRARQAFHCPTLYTQLWNQFDIDPGKLRCFPVFGQWLSLRVSAWNAGHKPPSWKKGRRGGRFSWGAAFHPVLGAARLPAPTINAPPPPPPLPPPSQSVSHS